MDDFHLYKQISQNEQKDIKSCFHYFTMLVLFLSAIIIQKHKKLHATETIKKLKCVGNGSKEQLLADCRPFQHVQII